MNEELIERVAELFYGGYCEPVDRLTCEWQDALELAEQAIPLISAEARKQVGERLNPDYTVVSEWVEAEHGDNAYTREEKQILKDGILRYLKALKEGSKEAE